MKIIERLKYKLYIFLNQSINHLDKMTIYDTLSTVLQEIKQTQFRGLSDLEIINGQLHFKFLGGQFIMGKSVIWRNKHILDGRLTLFHDKNLPIKDSMVEVKGFSLDVEVNGNIWVSHYWDMPKEEIRHSTIIDGKLKIGVGLTDIIFRELESMIIKEEIEIYQCA